VFTRPIPSAALFRAKLVAAALATAATWALVLSFLSLLLLRPGFAESIGEIARTVPAWKAVGIPVMILVLLVALTWINMVASFWISLTGRTWVASTNTIGFLVLLFCGASVGLWIYFHPGLHAAAWAAVPWITGGLVLLKALAAIAVLWSLDRRRLIGRPAAAMLVGAWSLLVAGLYFVAYWLTPSQFWSASGMLAAVVLNVNFSRLIGAPLALEWNRHR
jgi:hypothetical protein